MEGAGASSRLVLIVKAGTKSGYAGVTPNGKLWRARIYKATKKQWDTVGTYGSPKEAAIQPDRRPQRIRHCHTFYYFLRC